MADKRTFDKRLLQVITDGILDAVLPIGSTDDFHHKLASLAAASAGLIAKGATSDVAGVQLCQDFSADVLKLYYGNRQGTQQ